MSTIGIKIANGKYYPIIETSAPGKKRLVLTTVKDHQDSVQVDMYRGEGEDIESAAYIGSLVLENLVPGNKGEPELELIVGIDDEGVLNAAVGDAETGEKQSLSLSLDSLASGSEFDLPDFDMDSSIEPSSPVTSLEEEEFSFEDDLSEEFGSSAEFGGEDEFPVEENFQSDDSFSADEEFPGDDEFSLEDDFEAQDEFAAADEESDFEEPPPPVAQRRTNPGLLVIFVLLGLIIIGLLAFLIYRSFQGEETPGLFARLGANRTEQVQVAEPEPEPDPIPAAQSEAEPAAAETEKQTLEKNPEPAQEPQNTTETKQVESVVVNEGKIGGVWYWIKWGDTLWDLSYSFYRTPWLYGKIAGANNIYNPDLIYANTRLFIPEL